MRISIKNGRVLCPSNNIDDKINVFIDDAKIVSLNKKPSGFKSDIDINAKDKIVLPGLVDICARLGEIGSKNNGTIKDELRAANSSGVTSICVPPDIYPIIDTPAAVEFINRRASQFSQTNIFPLGALTQKLRGEELAEMFLLKAAGCVGVSNGDIAIENTEVLRRSFEYAKSCDLTVFIFAEDKKIKNNGVVHEGAISTRLGLPAIPETAETIAISKVLLLIEQTNVRAHFCRLSSGRSVELIREAKKNGAQITADVPICNLHLTDMDIADYDSNCHLRPPLRDESDRVRLVEGLIDGTISAVCSNHQPVDANAKSAPFSLTQPGASTIEHILPLIMHIKKIGSELSLKESISLVTSKPASILGIEKGMLKENGDADICIFDPNKNTDINKSNLLSAGKNTPFGGWELDGKVTHTILGGKLVFNSD
ncbi:MAG: dihydroorotase [Legionellales bacterium]|nr:dihydroorotase [Legionellales bacterium]